MAIRYLTRSLLTTTKQNLSSTFSRSYTAASSAIIPSSSSFLFRLRPLVAVASVSYFPRLAPVLSTRGFATRQTSSFLDDLDDPNLYWSDHEPEGPSPDGCDFEHWLVVMKKPDGEPTRDELIDSYIKTLAMVVGSEEEARMKIYSVSTRHYFAFGALVSEELSDQIKELPKVQWVLPDSYLNVRKKDYGGEPFINGQAVPYDPKYHKVWVRNNARENEWKKRRANERRRDMQMGNPNNVEGPGSNMGGPPNMASTPPNVPNTGAMQPNNMGGQPNYGGGVPPGQNPNMGPGSEQYQNNHVPNSGLGQGHSQNGHGQSTDSGNP